MIDKLKSTLQKIYGENIKRINLISITEKERKEEIREGKGRKNPTQGSERESHTFPSDSL